MEKMGNMANDGLIRRPFQRHRPSSSWQKVGPEGLGQPRQTRISNRKSGIRIPRKSWEISAVRISNRKYFAISDLGFSRSPRFLIYGGAIRIRRNTLKRGRIRISNRR
jgi:hypothetical protein